MQLFVTSKRESKELLCGQRWDDDNSHPPNQRPGPATSHKTEMFFCSCCLAVFCFFHVADGVSWSLTKIEQEESTSTRTQLIALELVARCWSGETIPPYRFFFFLFLSFTFFCSLTFVCMLIQWIMDRISSDDASASRLRVVRWYFSCRPISVSLQQQQVREMPHNISHYL